VSAGIADALFYAAALVALVSALFVVGQRHPIGSAFALVVTMCSLSIVYGLLGSPFVAVLQVVVYAGAIMVLFLFVVMLLNVPTEEAHDGVRRLLSAGPRRFGAVLSVLLVAELAWALQRVQGVALPSDAVQPATEVYDIGIRLFRDYAFAFEATSVLILIAMVGAIVLARKEPR
jgi:NADH-quinone oxidoreductase subunit J